MPIDKKEKVALITGGICQEREVALIGAKEVFAALQMMGVNVEQFDARYASYETLITGGFTKAFIALHGKLGEDGTIQGLLECYQIPYTGSGVLASALAMDKHRTQLLWQASGIPTPKSVLIPSPLHQSQELDSIINNIATNIPLPLIVKPTRGGSTLGLSKLYDYDPNKLEAALNLAFRYDNSALIQHMIIGSEYALTICNNEIYPLVKIEAPNANYDYQHKYFSDDTKYICPVSLDEELNNKINQYAKLAYQLIGASSVARIDIMVDAQQQIPYFIEINTIPGMTPHSLVPLAFKARGIDFNQMCLHILSLAKLHNSTLIT